MSLKFGIYLVEQRIISPEQFCGLVKIQQESLATMPSVALRKNMMTIKQVATVLDIQEAQPAKSFTQIALENDFLDSADVEELIRAQQQTTLTIRQLLVECELLTERQVAVLYQHFEKVGTQPLAPPVERRRDATAEKPIPHHAPTPAHPNPATEPAPAAATQPNSGMTIRGPKFKQRPVVVHPYSNVSNVD